MEKRKTVIYAKLISFSLLLACGQILFKAAANKIGDQITFNSLILNGWLIAALALYAGATFLWVLILRTTPLSLAYPFAALGFIIVPAAGFFIFKEEISIYYVIGASLIVTGIILTNMK